MIPESGTRESRTQFRSQQRCGDLPPNGEGPAVFQIREPPAWSTPNRIDYWFGFEFELEVVLLNDRAPRPWLAAFGEEPRLLDDVEASISDPPGLRLRSA